MRACLHAWMMFLAILACSLSAGCSEVTTMPERDLENHSNLQAQFGTIDKVSVMTTDGQEIYLNKNEFLEHVAKEEALLSGDLQNVKTEDVRFTLIVYRAQSAPFVLEIGSGNKKTDAFYQWIRKEAAEEAFRQLHVRTLEVEATDLNQHYLPTDEETAKISNMLSYATYSDSAQTAQYSLYPGYQMVINTGERSVVVKLLSPSLIGLTLGKEQLFYTVSTDLFSLMADWLPPEPTRANDVFDPLLRATKVILAPSGDASADTVTFDPGDSTRHLGLLHETVRELKQAKSSAAPVPTDPPAFSLRIQVGETEHIVRIYGDTFRFQGKMYQQPKLKELMDEYRQILLK